MPTSPSKSQMIEGSLRCCALGAAGLVPVLGLPCCILAFRAHCRVRRSLAEQWNAAESYLTWGVVLARIGFFVSLLLLGGVGLVVFYQL